MASECVSVKCKLKLAEQFKQAKPIKLQRSIENIKHLLHDIAMEKNQQKLEY